MTATIVPQETEAPPSWQDVVVLIPCYNEALTIDQVVHDFRHALPRATIYVYDNNSADCTVATARDAGAVVRSEALQGKGNVVRRMFADIEADIYLLVDGDGTYDANSACEMIELLAEDGLDMVSAIRVHDSDEAYRRGHQLGNVVLTGAVRMVFGARISDVLSGYRAFSRRFVKSFPGLASGFEIETEFTVHALELRMPLAEVRTRYHPRPTGSYSKLHTIRDGVRIVRMILDLIKRERPLQFFGAIFFLLLLVGLMLGGSVVSEFFQTGLVPRFPTAFLAASLVLLSFLMLTCGLILDSVTHGRRELRRLAYLSFPSPVSRNQGLKPNRDSETP
jgi:glycosyltransferase involved in cell wall biosynthesis